MKHDFIDRSSQNGEDYAGDIETYYQDVVEYERAAAVEAAGVVDAEFVYAAGC